MTEEKKKKYVRTTTGPGVVQFVHLIQPMPYKGKPTDKFSVTVLFDEDAPHTKAFIEKARKLAEEELGGVEGITQFGLSKPTEAQLEKYPDTYKGKLIGNFEKIFDDIGDEDARPKIYNHSNQPLHYGEIKWLNIVNCSVAMTTLDDNYGKRVKCYLNAIQKLGAGDNPKERCPFDAVDEVISDPIGGDDMPLDSEGTIPF